METKEKAQAADDIARGRKKDVKSFFLSHSKLKDKAGKLSVKQEEVDIRSTGARNDYILSVATANAHRGRYFENDFPVRILKRRFTFRGQRGQNTTSGVGHCE